MGEKGLREKYMHKRGTKSYIEFTRNEKKEREKQEKKEREGKK